MKRRGLYAIVDTALTGASDRAQLAEAVLAGGAVALQYRDKSMDFVQRIADARALQKLCRSFGAAFIVNDDVELAARVDADGVHIGREDAPLADTRRALGHGKIIGVSCYNEIARARVAVAGGADYVAFGSFFPSRTKPGAVRAQPDLIESARQEFGVTIVAIGGITADNAQPLIDAGADLVAVIRTLAEADNPRETATAIAQRFLENEALARNL